MYGKSFESQYSGSLVGAGLNVFAVWGYVIAKTRGGVVELNPRLMAAILGGAESEIVEAIEFLCKADENSRSRAEEGRRMVREGQFQYRVVNWDDYQTIKSADALKEYNRRKQAEYRARKRKRVGPLPGEMASLAAADMGDEEGAAAIAEASLPGGMDGVGEGVNERVRAGPGGRSVEDVESGYFQDGVWVKD